MKNNLNITPVGKAKTAKEIVYEELKTAIFRGDISPNEYLTETILAQLLNTSRTPVREAVSDLVKDGLFVAVPRKGLKVREISDDEKEQIFYLRISIEKEVLRRLVHQVTPEQIQEMRDIIDEMRETIPKNDRIANIDLDQKFHRLFVTFSGQNILGSVLSDIYNLTRLVGHAALGKTGRMEEVIEEHTEIVDALESKDEAAVLQKLEEHLSNTKESITKAQRNS